MSAWQRWVDHPQKCWPRKVLFQIHLWTGLAVGLYVAIVSISGSAIVYRRDLERMGLRRRIISIDSSRPRMSLAQLQSSIERNYHDYEVLSITEVDNRPDTVVLRSGNKRIERLFDPYSGQDLGDPRPMPARIVSWLADLHDNLLSGLTGRTLNGIGAALLVMMSMTGAVLWWPGIRNWRRALKINWRARFPRLNWDLHSAIGFWCFLFALIWGVSGIYLCLPGVLDAVLSSEVRLWFTRLHFGRFNRATEAVWTLLGLAPALLAVTGALMWWHRVLSKKLGSSHKVRSAYRGSLVKSRTE